MASSTSKWQNECSVSFLTSPWSSSILKNPNTYPGKHNFPTERTNRSQPPLEPKSQMQIIWKALITYLDANLR